MMHTTHSKYAADVNADNYIFQPTDPSKPVTQADIDKAHERRRAREASTISDYDKRRLAMLKVQAGRSGITNDKYSVTRDDLTKFDILADDPDFNKYQKEYSARYAKWDSNYDVVKQPDGSMHRAETKDKINNIQNQRDMLENNNQVENNMTWWDKLNTFSGMRWGKLNLDRAKKDNAIRDGMTEGYRGSIGIGDVVKNPRGAFKLYAESKGWGSWAADLADNPTAFWTTVIGGGVGIAGLVSLFLGSMRNNNNKNSNNINQQQPAPYNANVPPASTSFWRTKTNGIGQ